MRKIKKLILLIVVFMIAVSIKENTAFAEYVIQVVPTSTTNPVWTNITVSDAYDACQNLNKSYSTLGTTSLKAHLTTNADWYAVSLLTYSAYGNSTSNQKANNTTGNKTGIMNLANTSQNYCFTSSIMEDTSSNDNRKSLYDNINTPYVETIKNGTNRFENTPGRGLLANEKFMTGYGNVTYGNNKSYPIVVRSNLFGIGVGEYTVWGENTYVTNGAINSRVTFRPVIWNK